MISSAGRHTCAVLALLAGIGITAPWSAAAQGTDFAAGYSFLHENSTSSNLPAGWFASVGVHVNWWLASAGEVAGNYKTFSDPRSSDTVRLRAHSFAAGPRFVGRTGPVHLFGQVLFGGVNFGIRGTGSSSGSDSTTRFQWQPGVGVDWDFARNTGLRFGANERFVRADGETFKEFQFVTGIVFRPGR